MRVSLAELAWARSGDKGDVVNVGVMAKTPAIYGWLVELLTPERVKEHFGDMVRGDVEVHLLPNIESINFVLRQALGGGATRTLRFDQTGKAMGAALLRLRVEVDAGLVTEARRVTAQVERRQGSV